MYGGRKPSTQAGENESSGAMPVRDRGVTFIEILVSVILLGTAVVASLAALRATVIGTRLERDHSKAHQWLQSSVGVIEDEDFGDCVNVTLDEAGIIAQYQAAVDAEAGKPEDFDGTITVIALEVWDGMSWVSFDSQSRCLDDKLLRQQRVTVEARTASGDIIEVHELVKRDE